MEMKIRPGEIKADFLGHDITTKYLLDKPGKYTISAYNSNQLVVDVSDCPVPDKLKFMRHVIDVLPKTWSLVCVTVDQLHLVSSPTNEIANTRRFSITFTELKESPYDAAEYFGETTMGHVWITMSQPDIVKRWPNYKSILREQLKPFVK
jgi:hypothetical protein